tara:strand:- start:4577 stop:4780 length:204 start_codon:yes stop_codon:yes gene_type:complete
VNPYKKELMRLDALVVRLRAKVKQLEQELAEEKGRTKKAFNPSQISRTDGLDFFEAYTGLQIRRMKL